jgi:hypothetical protein
MAIGRTEIYIISRYETWIAGCRFARLTTPKPAVLVETAWNQPSRTRILTGSWVTIVFPSFDS